MKKIISFLFTPFTLVGVLVFTGITIYALYYMPHATGPHEIQTVYGLHGFPSTWKTVTGEEATRNAQENIIWAGILPLISLIAMGIIAKQKNWRLLLVLILTTTLMCLCIVIPTITHPYHPIK